MLREVCQFCASLVLLLFQLLQFISGRGQGSVAAPCPLTSTSGQIWSGLGLGEASCTQLLHMAFEETFCLFTSAAPSHGGDFTPGQVVSTVWSQGFNQGCDNDNSVVGVLAEGAEMSFLTVPCFPGG